MKVAIVASSFLPEPGRLERRVDQLARGLARRGAEVEILTQGPVQSIATPADRVIVRRFPTAVGPMRFAVAPKLWETLRLNSDGFDLVDVHTRQTALALAVARSRVRRLVFTPYAPMDSFLSGPYTRAIRACIASATQIVCQSELERDLLCAAMPGTAPRTEVLPDGVDADALRAAKPFAIAGTVVLAVDRLHRSTGVRRAIAAMPSLDPEFRLVVVGDGPERDRLAACAADLRISSRVQFVGAVSDAGLYRWLRTAGVVVTLAGERGSGSQLTEALAAGASVVASDLPIHREAADRLGGGPVVFVPPTGSPLDVADAIDEAARVSVLPGSSGLPFTALPWESVVDSTWALYGRLVGTYEPQLEGGGGELLGLHAPIDADPEAGGEPVPAGQARVRSRAAARGSRWQPRRRRRHRVDGGQRWP